MGKFLIFSVVFAFAISETLASGYPPPRRVFTLPSVSDDHYSELLPDGTYKYAYTGENRYVAERRTIDGRVEGETLYVRPDGIPIKVHYFSDSKAGYRPKTEIIHAERLKYPVERVVIKEVGRPERVVIKEVPIERVVVKEVPVPVDSGIRHVVSPFPSSSDSGVNVRFSGSGSIAAPEIQAVIGPGANVELVPEAYARTGDRVGRYYGEPGDVAVSNPKVSAIIGPGASVSIRPKAKAVSGGAYDEPSVVTRYVDRPFPVSVQERVHHVPVIAHAPPAHHRVIAPVHVAHHPEVISTGGVVVVPPRPSYRYTYSYSSADQNNPYKDNKAFVDVQVNQ